MRRALQSWGQRPAKAAATAGGLLAPLSALAPAQGVPRRGDAPHGLCVDPALYSCALDSPPPHLSATSSPSPQQLNAGTSSFPSPAAAPVGAKSGPQRHASQDSIAIPGLPSVRSLHTCTEARPAPRLPFSAGPAWQAALTSPGARVAMWGPARYAGSAPGEGPCGKAQGVAPGPMGVLGARGFRSTGGQRMGVPEVSDAEGEGESAAEQRSPPTERVVKLVDEIAELTLLEVADLTALLKKKLGLPDMPMGGMPMGMMPMPGMAPGALPPGAAGGAAAAPEPVVEKTSFDVKLEKFDAAAKLKIIKEVRALTGLGLKESKDLVESAPAVVKKGVPKDEADSIVEKLKALGAEVNLE